MEIQIQVEDLHTEQCIGISGRVEWTTFNRNDAIGDIRQKENCYISDVIGSYAQHTSRFPQFGDFNLYAFAGLLSPEQYGKLQLVTYKQLIILNLTMLTLDQYTDELRKLVQ